jgi:hypothetical protein
MNFSHLSPDQIVDIAETNALCKTILSLYDDQDVSDLVLFSGVTMALCKIIIKLEVDKEDFLDSLNHLLIVYKNMDDK